MSSFLTAHQHILGYLVPYNDVEDMMKESRYNHGYSYDKIRITSNTVNGKMTVKTIKKWKREIKIRGYSLQQSPKVSLETFVQCLKLKLWTWTVCALRSPATKLRPLLLDHCPTTTSLVGTSFPRAAEFWAKLRNLLFCRGNEPSHGIYAFLRNMSNFCKYTPKRVLFSSLVPEK